MASVVGKDSDQRGQVATPALAVFTDSPKDFLAKEFAVDAGSAVFVLVASFFAGAILFVAKTIYNKSKKDEVVELTDNDIEESYKAVDPLNAEWSINHDSAPPKAEDQPTAKVEVTPIVDECHGVLPGTAEEKEPYYKNVLVPPGAVKAHIINSPHLTGYYRSVFAQQEEAKKKTCPDLTAKNLEKLREKDRDESPRLEHFFRPDRGTYRIRLLPPTSQPGLFLQTKTWFVPRKQHYLGNASHGAAPVQCLRHRSDEKTFDGTGYKWKGDCPVCNHWNHLWAMLDIAQRKGEHKLSEEYRRKATQIKGMERYYMNVLLIEEDGTVKGPLIYSAGKQVFEMLLNYVDHERAKEQDNEGLNPLSLMDGCDFRITKEFRNTHHSFPVFDVRPTRKQYPIGTPEQIEQWMANLWDLEKVAQSWAKTPEELTQAMVDAGIGFEAKKCESCSKLIRTFDLDARFCCETCLNQHIIEQAKTHSCCPLCGCKKVVNVNHRNQYECGYRADFEGVQGKCKTRPDCQCNDNKHLVDKGCTCCAKSKLVDKKFYAEQQAKIEQETVDDDFLKALSATM